ncbi:MAG: mechanosensitive ion channel protein MscS [Alteromonadaceae bacterium]|nr:MAG: mechanosensitive ion channel protein MscS [Alteromonadaceae bacterium]
MNVELELEQVQVIYDFFVNFLLQYSFQLVGAIIIIIIGLLLARKVCMFTMNVCKRKGIDITLSTFIANTFKILIIAITTIIALGKVGISITPFVAAIGALSLGAGLAMQGLLSNYGAGIAIIIARPFVVGDTIRAQNVTGLVKEVHLGYTLLTDEDGVEILIPNRFIIGEVLHNSHEDTLAEQTIGIAYDSDPEHAIEVIRSTLSQIDDLSKTRKPLIGIKGFGESSIQIGLRYWVPTQHYYQRCYAANGKVFAALKSAGVNIPFPQREIRILSDADTKAP